MGECFHFPYAGMIDLHDTPLFERKNTIEYITWSFEFIGLKYPENPKTQIILKYSNKTRSYEPALNFSQSNAIRSIYVSANQLFNGVTYRTDEIDEEFLTQVYNNVYLQVDTILKLDAMTICFTFNDTIFSFMDTTVLKVTSLYDMKQGYSFSMYIKTAVSYTHLTLPTIYSV